MSRELYRIEGVPVLQNRLYDTAEAARSCPCGNVVLVQDEYTGLVYNQSFDPSLVEYTEDYHNEQSCSSVFQDHLNRMADVVERHFRGLSLLEVGCGAGFFLSLLESRGFAITGIDPAYTGTHPRVLKAKYDPSANLHADGIILRHVLEHIVRPWEFLAALRDSTGAARILIEVPDLEWIVQHRAWFDIYYEHVNYFRLSDFSSMFGEILEWGYAFGGQYLYVVADLRSLRQPTNSSSRLFVFPDNFLSSAKALSWRMRRHGAPAVVWGAASKGVIFSLLMVRLGAEIAAVVDIDPVKQNRFLPVTGLRVWSPEEFLSTFGPQTDIYVMNRNYLTEVRALTGDRYHYVEVEG